MLEIWVIIIYLRFGAWDLVLSSDDPQQFFVARLFRKLD